MLIQNPATYDNIIEGWRTFPEQDIVDWLVDEHGVVHFIRLNGTWGGMCGYKDFRVMFPELPEIPTQTTTSALMGFGDEDENGKD